MLFNYLIGGTVCEAVVWLRSSRKRSESKVNYLFCLVCAFRSELYFVSGVMFFNLELYCVLIISLVFARCGSIHVIFSMRFIAGLCFICVVYVRMFVLVGGVA